MTIFLIVPMLFSFSASFLGVRSLRSSSYGRTSSEDTLKTISFLSLYGTLGFLLFVVIASFVWAKLFYESFKFELSEKGLKIEKGVIWKRYVTIPYEKIQNVDIYRGPLERLLSLSEIHVQTAGFSGTYLSEGRIPALNPGKAEDLREELIAKIGRKDNL